MDCWVETISDDAADGMCRRVYDRVRGADGTVDPLYLAHGLRPATVAASDQLYKAVLHCCDNQLPKWLLELVAAYSALLLGCDYAAHHHGNNFRAAFVDNRRADEVISGLRNDDLSAVSDRKGQACLGYARRLTLQPSEITERDIAALRAAGASDGEIVEVNQVCASFNYFARVLNGLGVKL